VEVTADVAFWLNESLSVDGAVHGQSRCFSPIELAVRIATSASNL
jgi:hypothetical protein